MNRKKLFILILGDDMNWMGFKEFTYEQIVPACLVAPLKPSFDLNDGQSFLVSQLKSIYAHLEAKFQSVEFSKRDSIQLFTSRLITQSQTSHEQQRQQQ